MDVEELVGQIKAAAQALAARGGSEIGELIRRFQSPPTPVDELKANQLLRAIKEGEPLPESNAASTALGFGPGGLAAGILVPAERAAQQAFLQARGAGVRDPDLLWRMTGVADLPKAGLAREIPAGKILDPTASRLSQVYENPELYDLFPQLANAETKLTHKPGLDEYWRGVSYGPRRIEGTYSTPGDLKELLEHEATHGVQELVGWPRGANQKGTIGMLALHPEQYRDIIDRISEAWRTKSTRPDLGNVIQEQYSKVLGGGDPNWLGNWLYLSKAGETQARAAHMRAGRTLEELAAQAPQYTIGAPHNLLRIPTEALIP